MKLRIDEDINPMGITKYFLMYQKEEGGLWSAISMKDNQKEIMVEYEKACENIRNGVAKSTTVLTTNF
jgi:hypothetical protein